MTFQTPLTSGNYDSLRGTTHPAPWYGNQRITLCKNTVVFQGQIAAASSLPSIAAFAYNNVTVGAYTDVEVGETLLISHDNNIRHAFWRGRIRKDPDATFVYMNETSVNLTIGDYYFVIYDFDGWDILSRMVGTTQYWDFDKAYHPLAPITAGLQTAYVNDDPADGTYRIVFDVRASKATDQYSTPTLSYQFTFLAGTYTVFAGSLSSPVATVDFDANVEQWGKLVVTDSQGTTRTRRFYIRTHGSTDAPANGFNGAQITGNMDSGWNATVGAFDGVENVLAQTFTVIWLEEWLDDVKGSIYNNIDLVGRFHREKNHGQGDVLYSYIATADFDIEGISTQMQRLEMQDLTTIDSGLATVVDEISFNTPQRSIVYYWGEHSTFLSLCSLTFPDGFDLTYLFQYIPASGGNIRDGAQSIAKQFCANLEFARDGRIQVAIDTRFKADKSAVVDVADFDNRDFTAIQDLSFDPVDRTGRLDAYGASYNSGNLLTDRNRAPGSAQGYAAGQSTLDAQILAATSNQNAAKAELGFRAGQQMAIENLTFSQGWQATHGGYHFLNPSRSQRVTHTYLSETNIRDLVFTDTDYWQVISITINHDNNGGGRQVTTQEELEPPVGDSGDDVPQIGGGSQTNIALLGPVDPFPALPDDPSNYQPDDPTPTPYPPLIPPRDGNTIILTDGDVVDTSRSVVARRRPVWTGITPRALGSFSPKAVAIDLTTPPYPAKGPIGAYEVDSDGTNSEIQYTPDMFASPVVWTPTATPVAGEYRQLRAANTPGSALIYAVNPDAHTVIYDFTVSQQGWIVNTARWPDPIVRMSWQLGVGFQGNIQGVNSHDASYPVSCKITFPSSRHLISCRVFTSNTFTTFFYPVLTFTDGSTDVLTVNNFPQEGGLVDLHGTDALTMEAWGATGAFPCWISKVILTYGPSTNANVRSTADYGATIGSLIDLGSSPGPMGMFDLIRFGGASIAAAQGEAQLATSLGASYSTAPGGTLSNGSPSVIVIPIRKWDLSARQDNSVAPDYLLGADANNSGACLWRVTGAGTRTNITPISGALCLGPNLASVWQTLTTCHILVGINDGGAMKIMRSADNGATWTLSKAVGSPIYLRYNRSGNPVLYLLDGSDLWLSFNHGISWVKDSLPSSNVGVGLDSYS